MGNRSWLFAWVVVAGCVVREDATDVFWDEASEDDASDGDLRANGNQRVAIDPGDIDTAELVKELPVGKSESGATRRVALQLRPAQLPQLARGDRLITPAEVQVTTRCDVGQNAPGCNYNPTIRAVLILTGDANDTDGSGAGSKALSKVQTKTCTAAEHHCKFVFRPSDATNELTGGHDLPCIANGSCHVNLVMWAWNGQARSGGIDKVLVGSNDMDYLQNGEVDQDQARLMVVRERGITGADRAMRESGGSGSKDINTSANPEVIYSHELKAGSSGLKAGEQYLVEAKLVTTVADRARFSTEMFLTRDKDAKDGNLDKIAPGSIAEHNGINCTQGTSPCTTQRVAVFRVQQDIQGPVYVNVVAKSAVPGGGSTRVTVKRGDGWVRSVRYNMALGR